LADWPIASKLASSHTQQTQPWLELYNIIGHTLLSLSIAHRHVPRLQLAIDSGAQASEAAPWPGARPESAAACGM